MINEKKRQRLGEILLQYSLITEAQLEEALRFQQTSDKRLGEILVELEVLNTNQVAEALGVQLELPFIQLDRYQDSPDAVKLVPVDVAERLQIIPLYINDDGALFITMAAPLNLRAQDEIRRLTGYNLSIAVSGADDLKRNISRIYNVPCISVTVDGIELKRVTETEENVSNGWHKLGELLVNIGVITKAQLEEALRVQRNSGKSLVEIFIKFASLNNLSIITAQIIAECLGLSYIMLDLHNVSHDVIKLVPQNIAERLKNSCRILATLVVS